MDYRNLIVLLAPTIVAQTSLAGTEEVPTASDVQSEINQLRTEINDYRSSLGTMSIDEQRAASIREMVADTLADAGSRINLQQADEPIFPSKWNTIGSPDGNFSLNTDFYAQIDWIYNNRGNTQNDGSAWGMAIRRCRLTFTGNVIDPTWNYFVRLQFGSDGSGSVGAAFIEKDLGEGWSMQAGLLFAVFSLEEAISNVEELGADLSFVAGQFDTELVNGVLAHYESDDYRFWLTYCNGARQINADPLENNMQGVLFRGEYKFFGNWDDLYNFNPQPESTEPGLMLGAGATYNWGNYDTSNVNPSNRVYGPDTYLTTDLTWQMPGFSIMSCAYYQDSPNSGNFGGTRWAAVGQVTGFVLPELQLYARGEWGTIRNSDQTNIKVMTLGASYYPYQTRNVKITAEFIQTWGSTLYWQLDGNLGFINTAANQSIFRTQLQVAF